MEVMEVTASPMTHWCEEDDGNARFARGRYAWHNVIVIVWFFRENDDGRARVLELR